MDRRLHAAAMPAPRSPRSLGEPWHQRTPAEVATALGVDPVRGLAAAEAVRRLARYGPNRLPQAAPVSGLAILRRSLAGSVVRVLVGAGAVTLLVGRTVDAAAVLAIAALHAALGFARDYRAQRVLRALARLTAPSARVLRDGRAVEVAATAVVRGDVLLLDAGALVAADARLIESSRLRAGEAALTGEPEPADKRAEPCPAGTPVADRRDMVFLGTSVVAGSGRALVVETGAGTELGGVAARLESAERPAGPLETQLQTVGRTMLRACLAIVLLVAALGVLRDRPPVELFLTAVSLAIAAVPDGLPAVLSLALALGARRMSRRNALVRRLPAAETLGATQVVCTDADLFANETLRPLAVAREAVLACRRAGIRPVMISGDHPEAARAIAREAGILGPDDHLLTAAALDRLDERALDAAVAATAVYAGITAEQRVRIVRAWQRHGAVVVMTGHRIEDAAALSEADVGVALGRAGTEVARAAADVSLADDDFATLVAAVEEGRGIRDDVQKALAHLVAGNVAALAVMLVPSVLGCPLPLLPIQLLWVNLVADALPALALATDPPEPGVLARPPRGRGAALVDRGFLARALATGALVATVTLAAFALAQAAGERMEAARGAAFSVLVSAELLRSLAARRGRRPRHAIGLRANARLLAIVLAGLGLQVALHHVPALESVFALEPVPAARWTLWLALGAVPLAALELAKRWARRRQRSADPRQEGAGGLVEHA